MYGTAFDDLDGVSEGTIPSSLSPTYAQFTPPPSRCNFPISKMVDASFWGRSNWQIDEPWAGGDLQAEHTTTVATPQRPGIAGLTHGEDGGVRRVSDRIGARVLHRTAGESEPADRSRGIEVIGPHGRPRRTDRCASRSSQLRHPRTPIGRSGFRREFLGARGQRRHLGITTEWIDPVAPQR